MTNVGKLNSISICETDEYLQFRDLFIDSGLEFNLADSGTEPEGFVTAFECKDSEGKLVAGSSITKRKGYFIFNDIAVDEAYRGIGLGKVLFDITMDKIRALGGSPIYLTARAPKFFAKYGFTYLEKDDVPDVFSCLGCKQLGKTCHPEFMVYRNI